MLNRKQSQEAFKALFSAIDSGIPIPGTPDYAIRQKKYLSAIANIKPRQVYRTPTGQAVRIIRYIPETQQYYVTSLFDGHRRSVMASEIIDGNYIGYMYKKKVEKSETPKHSYLIKH